eukprot:760894-Hanusia_phi.AAC.2
MLVCSSETERRVHPASSQFDFDELCLETRDTEDFPELGFLNLNHSQRAKVHSISDKNRKMLYCLAKSIQYIQMNGGRTPSVYDEDPLESKLESLSLVGDDMSSSCVEFLPGQQQILMVQ